MTTKRINQNAPTKTRPQQGVSPTEQNSKAQDAANRSTIEVQTRKAKAKADKRSFSA